MGYNPAPINQLHEPTVDGGPDEAAQQNCVPASLAWILEDLTGGTFDGDQLRDMAYPESSTGGTAIPLYLSVARRFGVTLTPVYGTGDHMVAVLHQALAAGDDALITIPSAWNAAPPADPVQFSGYTHVCAVAYVLDADHLRLMNPWGGVWQDVSNEWLAPRLCYGVVWLASNEKVSNSMGWTRNADGTATDNQGHEVGVGFAATIFQHGWESADGLTGETYYDSQDSYCALSNGVVLHYHPGSGVDQNAAVVVAALADQLAQAKAGSQDPAPTPAPAATDAVAEAAKAALATLKSVLAEV